MSGTVLFLATACLLLAAVMIPVPPRSRAVLWAVMLGAVAVLWVGVGIREFLS